MTVLCSFGQEYAQPNYYTDAIERAGAQAFCVYAPTLGEITSLSDRAVNPDDFDALLLTGGGDVNPLRYGEENLESYGIDEERDRAEFALIDAFVKAKKPIFGICRGMQILNVAFGGSLIQDLKTSVNHRSKETVTIHEAKVEEGTPLADVFGKQTTVNSFHHQAVKKAGKGFSVAARSLGDGTAEAIVHASLPIFAVQWHPERMAKERAEMQKLFDVFCGMTRLSKSKTK